MPPDHPLASSGYPSPSDRYPRIDLSTLASEPFILHFPEQTTGKLVLEALDRAGVQPRVPVRSRNTETCVKLCMQGMGMCFTPEQTPTRFAEPEKRGDIERKPPKRKM